MLISHSFNLIIIDQCLSEVFFPCYDICLQDDVTYNCTGIGANMVTWTAPNLMTGTVKLPVHHHQYYTSGSFIAQFVLYQNNTIVSNFLLLPLHCIIKI